MNYQTIDEIYEANGKIREKLKATINNLSDEQVNFRVDENTWTIAEIVEHISIVENGMSKICAKLLHKSAEENLPNSGQANLSAEFIEKVSALLADKTRKAQAPERVLPQGNVKIAESLGKMNETAQLLIELRPAFQTISAVKNTFPHPFFGDLSATEWLAIIGGHEFRHINQIERILSQQQ